MAIVHKFTTEELVAQKLDPKEFASKSRNPIVFVLHNIRSLENVGLFFRLADAFLVEKIYLTGYTGYPRREDNETREERIVGHAEREINKTAIKLVPFVPWEQTENPVEILNSLQKKKYQIVSVEQTDQSLDFTKVKYQFPIALIFGHERTGVEDDLLAISDVIVHIPMLGMGNSHNVAMSGAIITSFLINKLG